MTSEINTDIPHVRGSSTNQPCLSTSIFGPSHSEAAVCRHDDKCQPIHWQRRNERRSSTDPKPFHGCDECQFLKKKGSRWKWWECLLIQVASIDIICFAVDFLVSQFAHLLFNATDENMRYLF
jgi:hypothetical protein